MPTTHCGPVGLSAKAETRMPPPLWPIRVIDSGSPPNAAMFRRTHISAWRRRRDFDIFFARRTSLSSFRNCSQASIKKCDSEQSSFLSFLPSSQLSYIFFPTFNHWQI